MFIIKKRLKIKLFIAETEVEDLKVALRKSYVDTILARIDAYAEGYEDGHKDKEDKGINDIDVCDCGCYEEGCE